MSTLRVPLLSVMAVVGVVALGLMFSVDPVGKLVLAALIVVLVLAAVRVQRLADSP